MARRDTILAAAFTNQTALIHLKGETMRVLLASVCFLAALVLLLGGVQAGEKGKDEVVKLKGKITCAKCDLGKETECMTVIVAKNKDKKDVTYYFDKTNDKKYHEKICTEAKQGTVEGVVKTEGDKKIITVKKVTFE